MKQAVLITSLFILGIISVGHAQVTRLGLFHTAEEVAVWLTRSTDGPYKSTGDVSTNSPGDWDRISGKATDFLADPDGERWQGQVSSTCVAQSDAVAPNRSWGEEMSSSAFVYVVTGNTTHRDAVRDELLAQAAVTGVQFDDTSRWCHATMPDTAQPSLDIVGWLSRMILSYDYIRSTLTGAQQNTLDNWFLNAATFFEVIGFARNEARYPNRGSALLSEMLQNTDTQYDSTAQSCNLPVKMYFGSPDHCFWHGAWDNQPWAHVRFVAMAGLVLNNQSFITNVKKHFIEWVRFGQWPDGVVGDFHRWEPNRFPDGNNKPCQGLFYAGSVIHDASMIADMFARDGDTSLYDYTTSEGEHGTAGGTKSLLNAVSHYVSYYNATTERYGTDVSGNNGDPNYRMQSQCGGFSNFPNLSLNRDSWMSQANRYYKNATVTSTYTRQHSGAIPYPANPSGGGAHPYCGAQGTLPGCLFMFGQMENEVSPYVLKDFVYVSTSGSGSDCSLDSPCLLSTGNTKATSGQTVAFNDGTYGWFDTKKTGVTYQAINQHQAIILNTSSHAGGVYAIGVRHDDTVLDGLRISGGCINAGDSCGGGDGHSLVRVFASSGLIIRNSIVEKSAGALVNLCGSHSSNCSNILVEDSIVRDSGYNSEFGEGIYIGQFQGINQVNGVIIRRVLFQGIGCEQALDVKPGGINIEAYHNIFETQALRSGGGCGAGVDGVVVSQGNLNVHDNIFRNNALGESVFRLAPLGGLFQNNVTVTNTHTGALVRERAGGSGSTTTVSDNVFCDNSNTTISGGFTQSNNTFHATTHQDCTDEVTRITALYNGVTPPPTGDDDIADGLIAHLKFDDTILDSADGTTLWTHSGTPSYEAGQIGNALTLDGSESLIADKQRIGATRLFAITSNPYSVSGWYKSTDTGTLVASAIADPAQRDFQIAITTSRIDVYKRGVLNSFSPIPTPGSWHHVVVTWDGTVGQLYVDNALVISNLLVGSSSEDESEFISVGARTGGTGYFLTGAVDDVRIYNKAISTVTIAALFTLTEGVDANPPTAPSNIQITQILTAQLDLAWTPSVGDPVGEPITYRVESCDGAACGDFAEIGTTTSTLFSSTDLLPFTLYRFRVRANDPSNNFSAYSAIAEESTTGFVRRSERIGGTYIGGTFQ